MTIESRFRIEVAGHRGDLEPLELVGREAMSAAYRFDVRVAIRVGEAEAFRREALQCRATLSFATPAGDRLVHGVVDAITLGRSLDQGRIAARMRLVPRLDWLRHKKQSRIFQHLTTRAIAEIILAEAGARVRFELESELPARAYACQYQETDHAFVHRLFAEDGLFYWFEHGADGVETIVVADSPRAYPPIAGDPRVELAPPSSGSAMHLEEHHATRLDLRSQVRPTLVVRRGRDVARPLADLRDASLSTASRSAGAGGDAAPAVLDRTRVRSGLGHDDHLGTREQLEALGAGAGRHLESLRRGASRISGESVCRRLTPGHRFALASDVGEIEVVVRAVKHRMRGVVGAAERGAYSNAFEAVPAAVACRPPLRCVRPSATLETATVVGPRGAETHTDELGRVKVQFHWDMDGAHDERSSCWLRVGQAWAGAGFGTQFIPRVGMEVLVGFVGGDPDRPLVHGTVHNGVAPPPFSLPREGHASGVRTRSTPGGESGHELVFGDEIGAEYVSLRSSRTMNLASVGSCSLGAGGDLRIAAVGQRSDRTAGHQASVVDADRTDDTGGTHTVSIGKDATTTIFGRRSTRVDSHDQIQVGGAHVELIAGLRSVVVGTAKGEPADDRATVTGRLVRSAGGEISITSGTVLHLRCGDSTLSLHPDRIVIDAPRVELTGDDRIALAQGRGPDTTLTLEGTARVTGREVRVVSADGAKLELTKNAELRGAEVHIARPAGAPPVKREGTGEPGIARLEVRPEWFPPGVDQLTVQLASPSGEVVERPARPGEILELEGRDGEAFQVLGLKAGDRAVRVRAFSALAPKGG